MNPPREPVAAKQLRRLIRREALWFLASAAIAATVLFVAWAKGHGLLWSIVAWVVFWVTLSLFFERKPHA